MSEKKQAEIFFGLLPIISLVDLKVQTLSSNDISPDLEEGLFEFQTQLIGTHDFSSLGHLAEEFFQTAEETNEGAFVDIGHFAKFC